MAGGLGAFALVQINRSWVSGLLLTGAFTVTNSGGAVRFARHPVCAGSPNAFSALQT